ncbi:MAG: dehydrogenase [Rhodobacteraceae bacterium]|nr:dehydrogenase [Paracoccaceae bacterium]
MSNIKTSEILHPQDWTFPVPIAYGPGRLLEIGEICQRVGIKNPLIVTDSGSFGLPFMDELKNYLCKANISFDVFHKISPNPRDDEIGTGADAYESGGHDGIIAIGGGSALDGGKAICLTAGNGIKIWDFEYRLKPPDMSGKKPFPKLITIPTTAGTGAETESTAMVTHVERGMKFCIWHPELKPSLALLDPTLTIGLPAHLTAWTGADAMTHAIEAYIVPDFNPLCDGMALEGLALINRWLPIAVKEPENIAARGGMLVGSCLAGIAFLKGLGLVHAISHMIGAEYNTQHGLTNAIILPVVLRYNLPVIDNKVKRIADAMELRTCSADSVIDHVQKMLDKVGIPKSLASINIPIDCAERISQKAIQDSAAETNPRRASVAEIKELIEESILDARP